MNKMMLCFLMAGLAACAPKRGEAPVIQEEKMAAIMADLAVAEAATMNLSGTAKDSSLQAYIAQVFTLHGIPQSEYERNLHLYAQDLSAIERITRQSEILLGGGKKPEK